MQNENDQKPKNPADHLEKFKEERAEKSATKLAAVRAVKSLSNGDSQWTLTQEIFQDILAAHTIRNPKSIPHVPQMAEELKAEIEKRYAEEIETKNILLESIPSHKSIRDWMKKDGWDEAVWGRIRVEGLFNAAKRAEVIEELRKRAIDKSDVAAKIWLTLSGDYSEKMEVDNKSVDQYREINKVLHRKKED